MSIRDTTPNLVRGWETVWQEPQLKQGNRAIGGELNLRRARQARELLTDEEYAELLRTASRRIFASRDAAALRTD